MGIFLVGGGSPW